MGSNPTSRTTNKMEILIILMYAMIFYFPADKGALKHFFEMNDIDDGINWLKISKIIPHAKKTGSDRSSIIEEIHVMLDAADFRTKCIILMCSISRIRVDVFNNIT